MSFYAWTRTIYPAGVGTVITILLPRGQSFRTLRIWAPQVPALGARAVVVKEQLQGIAAADTVTINNLFTNALAVGGGAGPTVLVNQPIVAAADVWAEVEAERGQLTQIGVQGSAAAVSPWYFSGTIWIGG